METSADTPTPARATVDVPAVVTRAYATAGSAQLLITIYSISISFACHVHFIISFNHVPINSSARGCSSGLRFLCFM